MVEDELDISELLLEILGAEGYRAEPALDAGTAMRLVRVERPDAITLDLGLPDKEGRQVLRELKSEATTRGIPVVIVSALSSRLSGEERALAAAVVEKPFDVGGFLRVMRKVIESGPPLPS